MNFKLFCNTGTVADIQNNQPEPAQVFVYYNTKEIKHIYGFNGLNN